jgi:hypothetical protein
MYQNIESLARESRKQTTALERIADALEKANELMAVRP